MGAAYDSLRYVPAVSASTFHFRDLDTMGRRKAWGSPSIRSLPDDQIICICRSVRFLPEYGTASTWVEPSGGITFISEGPEADAGGLPGSRRGPFGTRSYALYRKIGPGSFPESSSPARRSCCPGNRRYYFHTGYLKIHHRPGTSEYRDS